MNDFETARSLAAQLPPGYVVVPTAVPDHVEREQGIRQFTSPVRCSAQVFVDRLFALMAVKP